MCNCNYCKHEWLVKKALEENCRIVEEPHYKNGEVDGTDVFFVNENGRELRGWFNEIPNRCRYDMAPALSDEGRYRVIRPCPANE